MNEPEIFQFPPVGLPGKTKYGGYVYVVEFDSGLLKVGMTQSPFSRIGHHVRHAATFGIQAPRCWLSPLHENPSETEVLLIEAATRLGTLSVRQEYFRGASFEEIVAEAVTFNFPCVDVDAAKERDRLRREQASHLFQVPASTVDTTESAARWPGTAIAMIFNRSGDAYLVPELHRSPLPDDLIQQIADAKGVDVEDILDMDYIDLIEQLVTTAVRTEALRMREYARRSARDDMLLSLREVRS